MEEEEEDEEEEEEAAAVVADAVVKGKILGRVGVPNESNFFKRLVPWMEDI